MNGSGTGAIDDATTTIPAFIRMKDDRGLAFYFAGDIDIHLADLDTEVAAVAVPGIVPQRIEGRGLRGDGHISRRFLLAAHDRSPSR